VPPSSCRKSIFFRSSKTRGGEDEGGLFGEKRDCNRVIQCWGEKGEGGVGGKMKGRDPQKDGGE